MSRRERSEAMKSYDVSKEDNIRDIEALEAEIRRYEAALKYIMLLEEERNMHLGQPRLTDKKCIFCMAYFALNNGAYGCYISEDDYKRLAKGANR